MDNETENETIKGNNVQTSNLSNKQIEIYKKYSFIMSRKIRWVIFFIFTMINLLMNFDHGTIPAATEQLRNYLNLTDSELGIFGSLVFLGVIIGSLFSLTIINIFNRKYILMACLILCGVSLFIFTITTDHNLLYIDRVIIGIFQAFISIYLPLWCDQFGIERRKALMMALIQVSPPLGVLVGYFVTTLLNIHLTYFPFFGDIEKNKRWLFSFYIQCFLIFLLSLCLLFFPDKYFNSKARRIPLEIEEALNMAENQSNENNLKSSFFYEGKQTFDDSKDENNSSKTDENESKEENKNQKNKEEISFLGKVKIIFSEPLFIFCMLTLSLLYFIVTCVQYWASDYMLVALEIQDETKRLYGFSSVCLTSPTFGLLFGGFIVDKLGGYSNKNSLIFCFSMSVLSIFPAIPLPFANSLIGYASILWALLFCGASLIPPFQGIIIACLPKNVQGSGNSFVIFFFNLLGYLPGPFVYGFLKDHFDDKKDPKKGSHVAQKFTIWVTFVVPIFVGIATLIRFIKDEEYNEKMGRDKTNKNEENEEFYNSDDEAIRGRESSLIEIKKVDKKGKNE